MARILVADDEPGLREFIVDALELDDHEVVAAPDGKAVAKYTFTKGWPCKFKGPALDSSKNELAIEELEIAHEGLLRQQ